MLEIVEVYRVIHDTLDVALIVANLEFDDLRGCHYALSERYVNEGGGIGIVSND